MAKILTVCTGNLCRSPLAELLLRQGLAGTGIEVFSAGVQAAEGMEMPPRAQRLARQLGVDPVAAAQHRAARLIDADVESSALILAMSREHRRLIAERHPDARRKMFTLREFARLSAGLSEHRLVEALAETDGLDERVSAAVDLVASQRGMVAPAQAVDSDDVIDPYRRSRRVYRRTGEQLAPAVRQTLDFLCSCLEAGES